MDHGINDERMDQEARAELLISRVVDAEATEQDWERFRSLAEQDPTLWREMAEYQRDHAELASLVSGAMGVAEGVEAPIGAHMEQGLGDRLRLVGTWGGWAAAAAVAIAWSIGGPMGRQQDSPPRIEAGLIRSPSQLFENYLEQGQKTGQVVGELPDKILLETRPAAGGGYEVYYLRQVIEKKTVPDLYTIGSDETGRPVAVPIEMTKGRALGPL